MKAAIRAGAGIALVAAVTFALALPAAAHKAEGPPTITCTQVSVELSGFPSGTHDITWHITVNGTEHEKTDSFTGPSGTSSVSISDLTIATGTLNITAFAEWDVDTGGKSETTELTTVCHEETTPPPNGSTSEGPPTEVAAATAERPAAAAAAPVTAAPTFTG